MRPQTLQSCFTKFLREYLNAKNITWTNTSYFVKTPGHFQDIAVFKANYGCFWTDWDQTRPTSQCGVNHWAHASALDRYSEIFEESIHVDIRVKTHLLPQSIAPFLYAAQ